MVGIVAPVLFASAEYLCQAVALLAFLSVQIVEIVPCCNHHPFGMSFLDQWGKFREIMRTLRYSEYKQRGKEDQHIHEGVLSGVFVKTNGFEKLILRSWFEKAFPERQPGNLLNLDEPRSFGRQRETVIRPLLTAGYEERWDNVLMHKIKRSFHDHVKKQEKMEDGRVWDNVVYCDRVGRIVSTAGTLVFLPVGNTDSKPLISITLLDFSCEYYLRTMNSLASVARYLVKSEGAGQVRLVVKPESRTPQTIDFAFSRLSHMAEFNNFRNYCIHNRWALWFELV